MDIWNIMAVIASIIVAGFTAWVAYETRKLGQLSFKALEIEKMPILGFDGLTFNSNFIADKNGESVELENAKIDHFQVGLKLRNGGRMVVNYRLKSVTLLFPKMKDTDSKYLSKTGRVLPGGVNIFYLPRVFLEPPLDSFPLKGKLEFEIEYSDEMNSNKSHFSETLDITISPKGEKLYIDWLHVDKSIMEEK